MSRTVDIGVNPFLDYLRVYAVNLKVRKELFDKDGGVVVNLEDSAVVSSNRTYETAHYFKGFNMVENRLVVMGLPSRSKELLWYICFMLRAGKDYVVLNKVKYMEEAGVGEKTFRRAVRDLVTATVMAESKKKMVFFINPKFFFNGNRIKKFENNVHFVGGKN